MYFSTVVSVIVQPIPDVIDGRYSKYLSKYGRYFCEIQMCIYLGDKRTLFGWFGDVYRGYIVGNGVFLAMPQRSQKNDSFQQYNHGKRVRTTQAVYVCLFSNAMH